MVETSAFTPVEAPVTALLVPGRGHDVLPSGELALTPSAVARVEATAHYFKQHEAVFWRDGGWIRFEGGWAAAAGGIPKPPVEKREAYLMAQLAMELGIPAQFIVAGIESTSSMDNCLKARNSMRGLGRVAIVTQASHADRLLFCAEKVWPEAVLSIIEAPGEDDPQIHAEEQRLLRQSRILYGRFNRPRMLKLADRLGAFAGRLLGVNPAAKYATAAN